MNDYETSAHHVDEVIDPYYDPSVTGVASHDNATRGSNSTGVVVGSPPEDEDDVQQLRTDEDAAAGAGEVAAAESNNLVDFDDPTISALPRVLLMGPRRGGKTSIQVRRLCGGLLPPVMLLFLERVESLLLCLLVGARRPKCTAAACTFLAGWLRQATAEAYYRPATNVYFERKECFRVLTTNNAYTLSLLIILSKS